MSPDDVVELIKRFEYEILSCSTKEEAKLYAREFILKMLKDKTSKYVMSLLLEMYRYLIRYFYISKDY